MKLKIGRLSRTQALLVALLLANASQALAGTWGLLASPGYENKPVKGIYFFPGDLRPDALSTSVSNQPQRDNNWNDSGPIGLAARNQVLTDIGALGTNVIFAVYNGPYTDLSFVNTTEASFLAVFFTSSLINGPLVIPSLEDSFQCNGHCPEGRDPDFSAPRDIAAKNTIAEKYLIHLVGAIVANGMLGKWAQIYDRSGAPRFAIQISQATASSLSPGEDAGYFAALEGLHQKVLASAHVSIGFILTPVEDANHYSIIRSNPDHVADLKPCPSCLAVMPYFSELPRVNAECEQHAKPPNFRGFIDCNEGGNIVNLARFKKDRTKLWVNSGAPYYVDLDAGYDAHVVFNSMFTIAFPNRSVNAMWGETEYLYDKWRNSQSELKGHQGDGNLAVSGVVYNSWNGYTEVGIALDSTHLKWNPDAQVCKKNLPCEIVGWPYPFAPNNPKWIGPHNFGDLRKRWLKDVFSADPRLCDHYYYENGQRKFHVFGAICEKFTEKYGEYGLLDAPASDAYQLGNHTVEDFRNGQIYWNKDGAREVHGGIYAKFKTLLQHGRNLGAPITDESTTPDGVGHFNHFELGSIYWTPTTLGVGIWGPFRDRWAALGWERGRLGYPTLEPTQSPGQPGWFARFQGGNMYARTNVAPAFEVWGSILAEYGRLGWERSFLGYPLTGEQDSGRWCSKGRFNQFEHGFIDWCPGKNACAHRGDGHCADGRAQPNF
jgi:hypothetical protein